MATKKAMENTINAASIELNVEWKDHHREAVGMKMMFMLLYLYWLWKVNDMSPSACMFPLSAWAIEVSFCNYRGTPDDQIVDCSIEKLLGSSFLRLIYSDTSR